MDDHDGARPRRHAALQFGRIDIVGVRPDVYENRLRAESADGASGGHKCKRRQKHIVSSVNAARAQCQNQRVRSRSKAHAVSDAAELGELFFQRHALAAQHKLLRCHHALDGRSNLTADRGVLRGHIKLRHGFRLEGSLRLRGHGFVARPVYDNWVLASGRARLQTGLRPAAADAVRNAAIPL